MKISKPFKIIIGVLTFAQIIGVGAFIYKIITSISSLATAGNVEDAQAMEAMMGIMGGSTILSLLGLLLLIFYIIHVAQDKTTSGGGKVGWILLFIFLGLFSMPIYFFMRVWNEKDPGQWDEGYGETV